MLLPPSIASSDADLLGLVNTWARQSWTLDQIVAWVSRNDLFKGALIVALFWWMWFARETEPACEKTRERVLITFIATAEGLFLARLRPLHDPRLQFVVPFGVSETMFRDWSSFPSDHAVLFLSLATGLWLISRRLGLLVTVYVLLFILGPRVYLGLHYPSDVIVGALIGIVTVLIANGLLRASALTGGMLRWARRHPGAFYGIAFLVSFEISTLFESFRAVGRLAAKLIP
jgi:undecaprenyl-diphosphatase